MSVERVTVMSRGVVKITLRQAEVMANLSRVTTDGSRHDPMFWLGEKNVSVQVRSLRAHGLVGLYDGRLVEAEPKVSVRTPTVDTQGAVKAMRALLAGGDDRISSIDDSPSTTKFQSP